MRQTTVVFIMKKTSRRWCKEAAMSMLRASMPTELIAKFTELPVEKILVLQGKE